MEHKDITELNELLSTGIGFTELNGHSYIPGNCVLRALKRIRKLMATDKSLKLRKHLSKLNALSRNIIPAFLHFSDDEHISSVCVEIFFILTESLKNENDYEFEFFEYYGIVQKFKTSFIGNNCLSRLMRLFKQSLLSFYEGKSLIAIESMEVYLFLFNNLSFTFPQCFSDSNFAKNYSIHDNIVLAFSDEHILDSIVLLSQQKFKGENVKIALLLMEIIFNVLNLESNKLNFSQKINKLSKLREKEQFKNKNIKNRSSNWNSQFVLSKNDGKNILGTSPEKLCNKKIKRLKTRSKTKKQQKRIYLNENVKTTIEKFVSQLISTKALNILMETIYYEKKDKLFSGNHKFWQKFYHILATCLNRARTIFSQNKKLANFENNFCGMLVAQKSDVIQSILDYIGEIIAFKSVKHAKMKWNRLEKPILLLNEITKLIFYGLKISDEQKNEEIYEKYFLMLKTLMKNFVVFDYSRFLLREYKETLNSIDYLKTLIELNHFLICLAKMVSDEENDNFAISAFLSTNSSIFQNNQNLAKQTKNSDLNKFLTKIPKFEVISNKNFERKISLFCHINIIWNYMKLLNFKKKNSDKILLNFFLLIADGLNKKAIFYRPLYIQKFQVLLSRKDVVFGKFAKNIIDSLFSDLKKYPFLVVEMLFGINKRKATKIENNDFEETDSEQIANEDEFLFIDQNFPKKDEQIYEDSDQDFNLKFVRKLKKIKNLNEDNKDLNENNKYLNEDNKNLNENNKYLNEDNKNLNENNKELDESNGDNEKIFFIEDESEKNEIEFE